MFDFSEINARRHSKGDRLMSNLFQQFNRDANNSLSQPRTLRFGNRAVRWLLLMTITVGLMTGCGKSKPQTETESSESDGSGAVGEISETGASQSVEKASTTTDTGEPPIAPDSDTSGKTDIVTPAGDTTPTPAESAAEPVARRIAGDPQLMTDHPWYPGELSCSTFERLFKTQAALYTRVTGRSVETDEDKAMASWYWRNLNYYHMMSPVENYWDQPSDKFAYDGNTVRDYWSGLFGYGFGLGGTTHLQWTAEHEYLLGHCRGRVVGVAGHNSYEIFLTGENYGPDGDWALLDHDISTIVFDDPADPKRLRSLWDITYQTRPPDRKSVV
mgnify:CR=1 FL=1